MIYICFVSYMMVMRDKSAVRKTWFRLSKPPVSCLPLSWLKKS
jgi:hypothetical protein